MMLAIIAAVLAGGVHAQSRADGLAITVPGEQAVVNLYPARDDGVAVGIEGRTTNSRWVTWDGFACNSPGRPGCRAGCETWMLANGETLVADGADRIVVTVVRTGAMISLRWGGPTDIDMDGDTGTDADIEAFFAGLGTGVSDFDGDGDVGTDADIHAFYRALGGG